MTKLRIAELDLLRFVAAVAVVVFHYGYADLRDSSIFYVTKLGFLGVQLFFMISGFVILWTAINKTALEFLASRLSRLYPSFWICVTLTAIALGLCGNPVSFRVFLANLTMVPGQLHQPMLDKVYWTLIVEIKFYVIIMALLLTRQLNHIRLWLALWLTLSVLAALPVASHMLRYIALDQFSVYFIGGCYLYLIRMSRASLGLLIPFAISVAFGVYNALGIQETFTAEHTLRVQWCVAIVVIAEYALFLAVAMQRLALPQLKLWGWLGAMTYPLYLIHDGTVENIGLTFWQRFSGPVRFFMMFAASLSLAWLLATWVERKGCAAFHRGLLAMLRSPRLVRE